MSERPLPSPDDAKAQEPQGLAALAELKLMWERYGADPEIARELRAALADGVVTQAELLSLRARVPGARPPKPRLGSEAGVAEVEAIKLKFGSDSDQAEQAQETLKDGVVTPEELASLRLMLARSRAPEEPAPEPKAKPDPRAIPFPTLEMKTPWRKSSDGDDNGDSGWGS